MGGGGDEGGEGSGGGGRWGAGGRAERCSIHLPVTGHYGVTATGLCGGGPQLFDQICVFQIFSSQFVTYQLLINFFLYKMVNVCKCQKKVGDVISTFHIVLKVLREGGCAMLGRS